jgi:hypothetical protein
LSKRVVLHVGTPETANHLVRNLLFRNRTTLREAGFLYPSSVRHGQFLAALDLLQIPWGGIEAEAQGKWQMMVRQVQSWPGTAIIGHEILASATAEQAAQAISDLGDTELHLLISTRDLGRQVPAAWQDNVERRSILTYSSFLERIQDPNRATQVGSWFWSMHELPTIVKRWGERLPPERIHLLTVPPRSSNMGVLWDRYRQAFGIEHLRLTVPTDGARANLGVPETALLRRINKNVSHVLSPPHYRPLVRQLLAQKVLAERTSTPKLALPPELHKWADELADEWINEFKDAGYHVIGDLADLIPIPASEDYQDPDRPKEGMVSWAGVAAIKALLLENAAMQEELMRLRSELRHARAQNAAPASSVDVIRERAVGVLEGNPVGKAALARYRRVRGRSSRPA